MSTSRRTSTSKPSPRARRAQGLTLVELLITMAVGLMVLALVTPLLVTSLRIKAREDQLLPMQQSLRAAAEVIAQDLRSASGDRIVSARSSLLNDLEGLQPSDEGRLVLSVTETDGSFDVPRPPGYPSSASYPVRANTPIESPNDAGFTCEQIFRGGELARVHNPDTLEEAYVRVHDRNPCLSELGRPKLNHHQTKTALEWSHGLRIERASIDSITTGTDPQSGHPALFRQPYGGDAQMVALGVTRAHFEYLTPDGEAHPTPTPDTSAVRFTLEGRTLHPKRPDGSHDTLTLQQVVHLRELTCRGCEANP